jgi:Tol biopolymer transport system component
MAIMAVPARGGSARTLVQLPGRPWVQSWSRDSRFLYFVSRAPDPQTPGSGLMRVSVDGGDPETVTRLPAGDDAPLNPYQIYRGSGTDASGGPLHVIATADGHRLGQVSLPKNVGDLGHAKRISADGKQVVAVVSNTVSSLKVLPVAGGSARPLGDARTNDVPIGWTPDGRVVFLTVVDGRVGVMAAPVEEGAAEEYTIIPDLHMASYQRPVLLSGDGQYLAFHRNKADSDGSSLTMARASDGETRTVTEAPTDLSLFTVSGPGGPATQGNEILYLETRGEISELRAASFDGASRLLRAFPIAERRAMGVFGDRVVWAGRRAEPDRLRSGAVRGPGLVPRRTVDRGQCILCQWRRTFLQNHADRRGRSRQRHLGAPLSGYRNRRGLGHPLAA